MFSQEFEDDNEDLILTEDETDVIINNLKDELIMESILEQIENPFNNSFGNADYLDIFETRYTYLTTVYKNSTTFINKINEVKDNMYSEIFEAITKKFDLKYTSGNFDKMECTRELYSFFVLDYRDNLITYLTNLIIKEKKSLALSFNDTSKSLGVNALKKVLKNKEDAIIISNLPLIIDEIVKRDFDNLDIISDICNDDISCSTNYHINEYFLKDFSISPSKDFINLFFNVLINKTDGFSSIINQIKMDLLQLAPKKESN